MSKHTLKAFYKLDLANDFCAVEKGKHTIKASARDTLATTK